MREVSQNLIENKKSGDPVAPTELIRTMNNKTMLKNSVSFACDRKRDKSESDMDIFTSGHLPSVAGFKREIGHRCVGHEY